MPMIDSLHEQLAAWPLRDALRVRLSEAFTSGGVADRLGLLRHVLRETAERTGSPATLRVPLDSLSLLPGAAPAWARWGLSPLHIAEGHVLVEALPWRPHWLRDGANESPERAAFAREPRRLDAPVPADPFLAALGWPEYRSAAQRDVLRAVLLAPPGSTLLGVLPTGGGKSLCGYIWSLLPRVRPSTTVIVVPTRALAMDQERALQDRLPGPPMPLAYTSDASDEVRKAIRERVRAGEQPFLITSPEALVGSLASSLYAAARSGVLQALVIDEAHLAVTWGEGFRSEYQALSGLRLDLLRAAAEAGHAAFRTLLLSATVTDAVARTLRTLFGEPGPFLRAAAVALRPETALYTVACAGNDEQECRVWEAIDHLPRPLILYATEVAAATRWHQALKERGYARLGLVTGATSGPDRAEALAGWAKNRIDLMVATAAFGVGIDQGDVRAVVHACHPESVDRWYQEIGRAGRDGFAAVALALPTLQDRQVAARLAAPALISTQTGRERWSAMFSSAVHLPDGRLRVSLASQWYNDVGGSYNEAWNLRTLTLLHRAGVLQLDSEPPPHLVDEVADSDEAPASGALAYRTSRVVRLQDPRHLDPTLWKGRIQAARKESLAEAAINLARVDDLMKGARCTSETFAEAYQLEADADTHGVLPLRACGGCAACRRVGRTPFPGAAPRARLRLPETALATGLRSFFGEERLLLVSHSPGCFSRSREALPSLVGALLARGIRAVMAPDSLRETLLSTLSAAPEPTFWVDPHEAPQYVPPVSALVVTGDGSLTASSLQAPTATHRLLFVREDALVPGSPHRRLVDAAPAPVLPVRALASRLGLTRLLATLT